MVVKSSGGKTILHPLHESMLTLDLPRYHKPIMLAGGLGTVRPAHALKDASIVHSGSLIIVLGGPAMLIGLGGGAASSQTSVEGSANLDFASVQR